jgi:cation transport ATPase
MKSSILIFSLLTFFGGAINSSVQAQSNKHETVTLQVPGVCNMCKARIETTSYDVSGVKSAKWDLETEVLTVVINPSKASRQKVADALAAVGYRSELAEADPKAYQKLPACCQYDSGIEKHN